MNLKSRAYRDMAAKVEETINLINGNPHKPVVISFKADSKKPDFKPNPKLGEGHPDKFELEYRQVLLDELKVLSKDINSFMSTDADYTVKLEALRNTVNDYISRTKKVARDKLIEAYDAGIDKAVADLKKIDVEVDVKKVEDDNLTKLIAYQESSIEKSGMTIYYKFKDYILRSEIYG